MLCSSCFFHSSNSLISQPPDLLAFYRISILYVNTDTNYSSLLAFIKNKTGYDTTSTSECPTLTVLHHLDDFHEICYNKYAITDHIKAVIYGFLKSIPPTVPTSELVKWEATNRKSRVLFGMNETSRDIHNATLPRTDLHSNSGHKTGFLLITTLNS